MDNWHSKLDLKQPKPKRGCVQSFKKQKEADQVADFYKEQERQESRHLRGYFNICAGSISSYKTKISASNKAKHCFMQSQVE